jgi:hypothetical protein
MHHSADPVNARRLQCSVPPWSKLGTLGGHAPCVTWDAIIRLHQAGRCCSQFGCSRYNRKAQRRGQMPQPSVRRAGLFAGLEQCSVPVSTPASTCVTSRSPPGTPTRAPRCGTTEPARTWIATPTTSSPPSWPQAPDHRSASPAAQAPRGAPDLAEMSPSSVRTFMHELE